MVVVVVVIVIVTVLVAHAAAPLGVVTLPARDEVVGLEQRFGGQALDVLVLGDVEDPVAVASSAHRASEAELGEVLRHSSRADTDVLARAATECSPCRSAQMMASRVGSARSFNVSAAASSSAPVGSETTFADTQIVWQSRPALATRPATVCALGAQ